MPLKRAKVSSNEFVCDMMVQAETSLPTPKLTSWRTSKGPEPPLQKTGVGELASTLNRGVVQLVPTPAPPPLVLAKHPRSPKPNPGRPNLANEPKGSARPLRPDNSFCTMVRACLLVFGGLHKTKVVFPLGSLFKPPKRGTPK